MKKDRINYKRPSSQLGGKDIQKKIAIGKEENTFPGYSTYPNRDDIYNKDKEEDLNPEETSRIKKPYKRLGKKNENKIIEDAAGFAFLFPRQKIVPAISRKINDH